ncbi:nuclear transport factor 2 family protein [Gordonia liuliyuniae]|uniref:Nuclear transport factor 2 family protein n=1 Tax=Gordonia liuliyuniae TaxID=2911517 RepID=A0ABS9ITX9_9ACTN|nr:nuclear transport factor 2 family protein [Gordonia liuliyuniae]MCF8589014.1 nuclear transport factor 2 family protein [Gordonia liuliyuniae]
MGESGTHTEVNPADLSAIHQLYGHQSHLIDGGHATQWAQTFTADGVFVSPSYSAPVVGTDALNEFAAAFYANAAANGEVHRHVLTNIGVTRISDEEVTVAAYLQIVATRIGGDSRLVRFTTVTDRVVRAGGVWRIAQRAVSRDDRPGTS